ncbi:hypothetical protein TorRG33x02_103370 [Trema orientale]|uniref:Uncharacterized protein n=1 Tax=Trema orientale TaxID=63057 RepID=A0A2P5F844_TREOI|nr:hypothetical protein TorRG33x02_103370 [Trema orientale]
MAPLAYSVLVSALLMLSISYSVDSLSLNHYDNTCPNLKYVVESAVKKAMSNDKTSILQMANDAKGKKTEFIYEIR